MFYQYYSKLILLKKISLFASWLLGLATSRLNLSPATRYTLFFIGWGVLPAAELKAQLKYTSFEEAQLVIGQSDFSTLSNQLNDVNTIGATAIAVSSAGKLAVASQSGGRVLIWNSLPTANGQPADVVIGKPDFTSAAYSAPSATSMRNCEGVAFSPDGKKLIVSDSENNRVLIWNTVPATNNQPADVVIGQTNFTSNTPGTSATKLQYPTGVAVTTTGQLIINEYLNNRVLIFNSIPATNGATADVVIGQPDLNSNAAGDNANQLNSPWYSTITPDGKLLIADSKNHRVLIYNTIPATHGASADVVIGQTGFSEPAAAGTAKNKLDYPLGIGVSAYGQLAIADFKNNRVLLFNQVPAVSGAAADVVLGQASFTANTEFSGGISARSMATPSGIHFDFNGRLFVSGKKQQGNTQLGRVLVFGKLQPTTADLGITATGSMSLSCRDITLQYRIRILNNGPAAATNIITKVVLPAGIAQPGTSTASAGSFDSTSGNWTVPALTAGQSATLVFTGIVPGSYAGRTIQQLALLQSYSQTDLNAANNTSGTELVVISDVPAAPKVNAVSICTGQDTTLVASGAGTINWFDAAIGGHLLFTGNTFDTPVLTATTTYYAEANNGCINSTRTPVTVTVNQPITNNIITGNQTICQNQVPGNLTGTIPTGGNGAYQYQWQVSTDGTTWENLLHNAAGAGYNVSNYGGIRQTTYFRRRVIGGPCAYNYSNVLTIKTNPLPAVLILNLPDKTCLNNGTITLSGSPAGGTFSGPGISGNIFNPAVAGTGAHTVSYSFTDNNKCTNTTYRLVLVGPTAYAGGNQTVCVDAPVFKLSGFSPAGGTWSGPGVSASGEFNPALAGTGDKTLTYSFTGDFGCGNNNQTLISTKIIKVNPLPALNTGGALTVCLEAADFYLSGYSPTGGTWSGAGVTATGYFSPKTAGTGEHLLTYQYNNGCTNVATKIITVVALPEVSLAPLGNKCSSIFTPVTLTGGSPAGGTYSGTGVSKNQFNPSTAGLGTHLITYTYTDLAGCTNKATQPVTVDICTGVAEDKILETLSIFPNPAQTQLTIRFTLPVASPLALKIQNLAGRQVLLQNQLKVSGRYEQTLDIRSLSRGVYLLQLTTNEAVISRRIVIN